MDQGYYGGVNDYSSQKRSIWQSRRGKFILIFLVMILITAVLGIVVGLKGVESKGKSMSQKLVKLIQKDDVDGSYQLLSENAKLAMDQNSWKTFVENNTSSLAGKKLEVVYTQGDGNYIEEGLNVGEAGSIIRVTVRSNKSDGKIETITISPTTL